MYAGSALVCHATLSWTRLSFNGVRTLVEIIKDSYYDTSDCGPNYTPPYNISEIHVTVHATLILYAVYSS